MHLSATGGPTARAVDRVRPTVLRPGPRAGPSFALAATAVLVIVAVVVSAAPSVGAGAATARALTSGTCNPPNTSPSALNIPLANSGTALPTGSAILVSYEFAVINYTTRLHDRALYMPSLNAVFPLATSGSVMAYQGPATLAVLGPNWSAPVNHTKTLTTPANLSTTASAYLTSSKLAVMSNSTYGAVTLKVRWMYVLTPLGANQSGTTTSAWSTPNATSISPYLPSIFFPAPYVRLSATSKNPAPGGSVFVLHLAGAVASTTFRIVVEYPSNGTETFSQWETTWVGVYHFNATANLSFANGAPLPAGNYLIHIHDRCQAIVKSMTVTVTKAPGMIARAPPGLLPR